ncbi:MAG: metallophosphoesterase family protein [Chloroflexota bacterium]
MRFGLLSDIHGNLAALQSVAAALTEEAPLDRIVVAGDLLQGGPRPLEVWEELRTLGWTLVQGNEDAALVTEPPVPAAPPPHPYQRAYSAGLAWTRARIGPSVLHALAGLPLAHRIATPADDLLIVHASPRSLDERSGGPHNTAAEVTAAYSGTGATAIAFGHYHRSFVRPTPFALLVNVASVGLPLDGRPLAAYTILTATPDGWIIEQRRVPYDATEEAAAVVAAEMPPWVPDAVDDTHLGPPAGGVARAGVPQQAGRTRPDRRDHHLHPTHQPGATILRGSRGMVDNGR